MDDADYIGLFLFVVVITLGAAFVGWAFGQVDAKESICKTQFHGEPHDNGALCISKDGKVIARF